MLAGNSSPHPIPQLTRPANFGSPLSSITTAGPPESPVCVRNGNIFKTKFKVKFNAGCVHEFHLLHQKSLRDHFFLFLKIGI